MPRWTPVDHTITTKQCSRCKEVKSKELFMQSKDRRDGYYAYCKKCSQRAKAESNKRVRERDPEAWSRRQRAYVLKYKSEHPERVKELDRKRSLRSRFGISVEEFDSLLVEQRHRCAICRGLAGDKSFAVDHDHKTGKIRGLLCSNCNTALGLFRDKPKLLLAAVQYLKKGK